MSELGVERQAVAAAARAIGIRPVMFEDFGGRDDDPEAAYLAEVESCDIYVGILGRRYGRQLPSHFSATHLEYRRAEECGSRISVWALDVDDREGPEQSFLEEARVFHVVHTFRSPEELTTQVARRFTEMAAEALSPWCKLGEVIFRASRIVDRGDQIEVNARIRNDAVAHALEAMRPGKFGGRDHRLFTWQGRSKPILVREVEAVTTASTSRMFRLTLEPQEPARDSLLDVTYGKYGPADLTEIGLRSTLFGEPNPLDDQYRGFAAQLPNPFEPLARLRVSNEIIGAIAYLLASELLVGTGRATRITSFRLGIAVAGRRPLLLKWLAPARFANEATVERGIMGTIQAV